MIPALFALMFALCLGETPSWWLPVPWVAGSATAGHFVSLDAFGTAALPLLADGMDATPLQLGLWLLGLSSVAFIANQVMDLLAKFKKKKPTELAQPIQIESVKQFVTVENFSAKFTEINRRFEGIELQIAGQVEKMDNYLHKTQHELQNGLNAVSLKIDESRQIAQGSASKAHNRIDDVAESLGEVRGALEQFGTSLAEIRTLLLSQAITGKK
jgi:hypothetical protein